MNFRERIERNVLGKKDPIDGWMKRCYVMCKEFGWTYEQIMSTPSPFIFDMMEQYQKDIEQQNKAAKRRR